MKIKRAYEIQEALEYAEASNNVDSHQRMLQTKWVKLSDVKAWLEEQKKELQKQEPQPTGEWLTLYMHKLKVFDLLIEAVQKT
jgi:hypothetical protein